MSQSVHFRGLRLQRAALSFFAMAGAFAAYSSMYAFRKPFTAGTYDGLVLWGIDYKILLIIAQVLGYMLSKFMGIRVVSEIEPGRRIQVILVFMGMAGLSLLLFGITPYPYNFIWMFVNGLPLGMMWGLVFSYLEGRRNTELLGAAMASSFVISSGMVKSVGKHLIDHWQVADFWMPFLTALLFLPTLVIGLWLLHRLPAPDEEDIQHRSERVPMKGAQRRAFFLSFAPGILLAVFIYTALTIFRDVRDNFSVEIWTALGYPDNAALLLTAEIPIAVLVFLLIALMIFIRNNQHAFFLNLVVVMLGGVVLVVGTVLFQSGRLSPFAWMILVGFGMYLAYISYHTMLFERWIAFFKCSGNIGFLMYIVDAFGYLGSIAVLVYKNFGDVQGNWLDFLTSISYIIGFLTVMLGALSIIYFWRKALVIPTN